MIAFPSSLFDGLNSTTMLGLAAWTAVLFRSAGAYLSPTVMAGHDE